MVSVSVITRWHNEEFFAPFFMNHYAWADEIVVLISKSTTDGCADIARRYPNAQVLFVDDGNDFNDRILSDMMSDYAASRKTDWVIRADADELTFPYGFADPKQVLASINDGNVVDTKYRWVYRHVSEKPLDPSKPAVLQRRHGGEYTIWPGMGPWYLKPTIARPSSGIRWMPGEQRFYPNPNIRISKTLFDGVHWQTADVDMWVKRNASNEARLSEENIRNKWGTKNFSEEMIRAECKKHEHDPQVF